MTWEIGILCPGQEGCASDPPRRPGSGATRDIGCTQGTVFGGSCLLSSAVLVSPGLCRGVWFSLSTSSLVRLQEWFLTWLACAWFHSSKSGRSRDRKGERGVLGHKSQADLSLEDSASALEGGGARLSSVA